MLISATGNALGADDTTIQNVENKAESANAKADDNNSRIQRLEKQIAFLQFQINNIEIGTSSPSVMYLRTKTNPPPECPTMWIEAAVETVAVNTNSEYVRICYNVENSCTVMVLEQSELIGQPVLCPSEWEEAGLSTLYNTGSALGNWQRVCYYCSQ
jgi:hypothetical protein